LPKRHLGAISLVLAVRDSLLKRPPEKGSAFSRWSCDAAVDETEPRYFTCGNTPKALA
jgi:hypothetical protein